MIVDEDIERFLAHHGVKGMRWGQRKQRLDRISRVAAGTAKRAAFASGRGVKKSAHWAKEHKKEIAGVAAGAIAVGIVLKSHQHIKVKDLRVSHSDFIKSKEVLDVKMYRRMGDLKDLASMTPKGHPSHESAMQEISKLHEFYTHRLTKMAGQHGISPETFKKMRLGDFT